MIPCVSIIIPAFNEQESLPHTLSAVEKALTVFQEYHWAAEIIVCDNNSSDATTALAREAGAKVVFEPVNQISRARNRGASIASGNWLVFVDADSLPSPELFRDMYHAMTAPDILGGGATLSMGPLPFHAKICLHGWNLLSRINRWMAGSFIFCQTQAFQALNGFSPELYASEEIDFSRRLKKLAATSKQNVVILHRHPLQTSSRKLHLYGSREIVRFIFLLSTQGRKALKSPSACFPWYDGRR
ncbi:MAG TPA: glycosyltransferase [Candidatus Paceibacterota bacterium]|nr:glycosyltransferase [Verrucomicrobiota bacterium]HRY48211.1 glycosyltransferase [Candidatus Paceibacterota bacterium]